MRKVSATSRADLLRALLEPGANLERTVVELGYEGSALEAPVRMEMRVASTSDTEPSVPPVRAAEPIRPTVLPRLRFLVPARIETRQPEGELASHGKPLTDQELRIDRRRTPPPIAPLVPWSRLGPYLRRRVGRIVEGDALDVRRILREVGRGRPLFRLPRLSRASWTGSVALLCDVTPEMYPFLPDVGWLLRRLRERGSSGLTVLELGRAPRAADLERIPRDATVVAVSAFGQFDGSDSTARLWRALGRRLVARGQPLFALTPVPPSRWQASTAGIWKCVAWDRHERLPRFSSCPRLQPRDDQRAESLAETLLTLLAPAARVEPPLLRAARLILGPPADAGTEWDAWHHEACWRSLRCCGFREGDAYEERLTMRRALVGKEAELARRVAALMQPHHASCSVVVSAEAQLRALDPAGPESAATVAALQPVFASAVERLRALAADPGSEAGRKSGLPEWFRDMVARLDPALRQQEALKHLIAEGLAFAHVFEARVGAELPVGLETESYRRAAQQVGQQFEVREYAVDLNEGDWRLVPHGTPEFEGSPLGRLSASSDSFLVSMADGRVFHRRLQMGLLPTPLPGLRLGEPAAGMEIETDRSSVRFDAIERPAWAESMHYDNGGISAKADLGGGTGLRLRWVLRPSAEGVREGGWEGVGPFRHVHRVWADSYGLAAQIEIGGVPFVLRWIPPGKFLMGSPGDEAGRDSDEGPQHEVTISRGFWLGETPVTQAQWAKVAEGGFEREDLPTAPSYFKGPAALPVEQVSWSEASEFCRAINRAVGLPSAFRLPTEAEWEFACRAGTQTALYSGGMTILGRNHAPELHEIAWYGGNSGVDLEVSNAVASGDWEEKQFEHAEAGTHRVKDKAPNAHGLYDMLGNVWEWCADGRRAYAEKPETDPTGPQEATAGRVGRGGAWSFWAQNCRAASRNAFGPGARGFDLGFRLAAGQELTESEPGAAEPPGAERLRTTEGRGSAPAP